MKRIIALIFILSLAITNSFANDVKEEIQEGVNFYLSFDGSLEADRSTGEGKAKNSASLKNQKFIEGISAKALVAKDKRIVIVFKRKDIIDFEEAGSISMWIKPIKWLHPKDMPVMKKTSFRKVLCQNFFLTTYSKNGYFGFERLTSPHLDHSAMILLYFANLKGIKANCRSYIDWGLKESRWHNIVLTWSPMTFKMYFDGKFKAETTIQRALKNNELNKNFTIECPAGTAIDEFIIYNKALSKEQIAKFYKTLAKDTK